MTGTADPELAGLLERLAAMPRADRERVFAMLGEAECNQLVPLLAVHEEAPLSPALTGLIRRCQAGSAHGLTTRTAHALVEVAGHRSAESSFPIDPVERETSWDRLANRLARPRARA